MQDSPLGESAGDAPSICERLTQRNHASYTMYDDELPDDNLGAMLRGEVGFRLFALQSWHFHLRQSRDASERMDCFRSKSEGCEIRNILADKLNAVDVLDMEYLRTIARGHDLAYTTDPRTALQLFAYDVVEAADVEDQNEILRQLLARMTFGHSKETNMEVLRYLADKFHTDVRLIAEFAKQEGILV